MVPRLVVVCVCVLAVVAMGREPTHKLYTAQPAPGHSAMAALLALQAGGWDVQRGEGGLELVLTEDEVHQIPKVVVNVSHVSGSDVIPDGYSNLAQVEERLRAYESQHPDVAQVVDITSFSGGRKTYEGRSIYGLKISANVKENEDEPNILVVSAHHCREIVTPEMGFGIIDLLLSKDMHAVRAAYQVYIVPVLNVDGYNYVFTRDNMWRKNRRPVTGSVGVDLNRNYELGWSSPCAGSTTPSSQTYKGTAFNSEAEVEAIVKMAEQLRFEKVLDFHSSGREILPGYVCTEMPASLSTWNREVGAKLAAQAQYRVRTASAEGEHQQNQMAFITSLSYLVETATSFQPSHASALAEVQRVMPLARMFLDMPPSVAGHVRDNQGGPVAARIERMEMESGFRAGETRYAAESGRFHMWLPPGTWSLRFSAAGYTSQTRSVHVADGSTAPLDVVLSSK